MQINNANLKLLYAAFNAAFKAGLAPFNTNYRYGGDELTYLFDNADAEAVVFHASFAEMADKVRGRLPKAKIWIAAPEAPLPRLSKRATSRICSA